MIFVASPYSSSFPLIQAERFHAVEEFVAKRLREGEIVISPIVHCHALAHKYSLPTDAAYWRDFSMSLIERADLVYVYCYSGWLESRGVSYEIKYARAKCIPISYWHTDGHCLDEEPVRG